MVDREKVKKSLENCVSTRGDCLPDSCPYYGRPVNEVGLCWERLMRDVLSLLKEQEAKKRKQLQAIADNQLAHTPNDSHEFMSLDEHLENEYKRGIWDGLQMAWNIISEGR